MINMTINKKLGAIILAAGKGKRMNAGRINKVVLLFAEKPLILHSVDLLEKMKFKEIIVVIGYAKKSVKEALNDTKVKFVEQTKRLGTANAVGKALTVIEKSITDVLVLQGDDSHFYNEKIISNMIDLHYKKKSSLTFLTIQKNNPYGLGRIVRDRFGKVVSIIEEKDANSKIKKIKEVNPACYIFKLEFLNKYLKYVPRSNITGEYYLTSLVDIALKSNIQVNSVKAGNIPWRGVNTKQELKEAEKIYKNIIG